MRRSSNDDVKRGRSGFIIRIWKLEEIMPRINVYASHGFYFWEASVPFQGEACFALTLFDVKGMTAVVEVGFGIVQVFDALMN